MVKNPMTFQRGNKIKERRLELRLTQEDAARLMNRKVRAYVNWENGTKNLEEWEFLGIMAMLEKGVE